VADELTDQHQFLLADLPPSQGQIRLALGIVVALLVAFGITAPFARTPLLRLDGFVPAQQGIYAVNDLITSALLFAQFSIVRRWALLALAIGFLYTALISISHALAFPGAFSPTGLLGAKVQTTAWLYNFWKVGLPLAVIVYALLKDADGRTSTSERSPRVVIVWSVAVVVAIVCALTWISIAGVERLPTILSSDSVEYSQGAERVIAVFQVLLCVVALTVLWTRRSSVLDLWLLVLSFTLVLEVATSTLLASARFDVGWYAARGFALAASLVVLLVLLSETTTLYANLARSVMRRRAAREARQIAMDAMAASIAHEVNQPLAAMVTNANAALRWLTNAAPDLDEARASLGHIVNARHRAGEVIGGIRSMFKKDARGRILLGTNDLVREILTMVDLELRNQRVLVATNLRDGLPQVFADRGQLQQVFLNLIMNAIDAMGSVTDRARVLRVNSDLVQESSDVVVTVEDTGTGIASEDKDRIFDSFFTTKSAGTGIGLSICRSIIESHGGSLQASANKPYGAIFQVTLPSGHL
jgi:signal transduction histidine kinase